LIQPTSDDRGWLIPFFGVNPWWVPIVAPFPALLAVILIFMDQQITAVIINRKENKLKVNKLSPLCSNFNIYCFSSYRKDAATILIFLFFQFLLQYALFLDFLGLLLLLSFQ